MGTDSKGQGSFSQFLFIDFQNVNFSVRYFWVDGVIDRWEFGAGPTIKMGNSNVLKLQLGGTTAQEVLLSGVLITKVLGRSILYIGSAELPTDNNAPNVLFQKLFIGLNQEGTWQFKVQDLQVGHKQSFLRFGVEYRQGLPHNSHLFFGPFYDPVRKAPGAHLGFRFF